MRKQEDGQMFHLLMSCIVQLTYLSCSRVCIPSPCLQKKTVLLYTQENSYMYI